jgi:hypothetical protein
MFARAKWHLRARPRVARAVEENDGSARRRVGKHVVRAVPRSSARARFELLEAEVDPLGRERGALRAPARSEVGWQDQR